MSIFIIPEFQCPTISHYIITTVYQHIFQFINISLHKFPNILITLHINFPIFQYQSEYVGIPDAANVTWLWFQFELNVRWMWLECDFNISESTMHITWMCRECDLNVNWMRLEFSNICGKVIYLSFLYWCYQTFMKCVQCYMCRCSYIPLLSMLKAAKKNHVFYLILSLFYPNIL